MCATQHISKDRRIETQRLVTNQKRGEHDTDVLPDGVSELRYYLQINVAIKQYNVIFRDNEATCFG